MSKIPLSYKRADFASDQEVKWCPGCGDYTILAGDVYRSRTGQIEIQFDNVSDYA